MSEFDAPHKLSLNQLRTLDVFSFWSPKLSRFVLAISESAYRLGVWLEAQPSVLQYSERPLGIVRSRPPVDFIALQADGHSQKRVVYSFVRAKAPESHSAPSSGDALDRLNAQFQWFDERSSAPLRLEVDNLCRMLPYAVLHDTEGTPAIEHDVVSILFEGPRTVRDIESQIQCERHSVRSAVFSMHFRGKLNVAMSARLSLESLVTLVK